MKFLRFIKKGFGIICIIFTGFSILFVFTEDMKIPFVIEAVIFGFLGYLLLKKPKKANFIQTTIKPESTVSYVENSNVITHTDGSEIPNNEVPYLISVGFEEARSNMVISNNIRLIQESYNIMNSTANPETLCSRYKFCTSKLEEIQYYVNQGVKVTNFDVLIQYLSDDNYCILIRQCYQAYMEKARMELKTKTGIDKRKQKFLNYIKQNVDAKILMKLSIF